MLRATMTNLDVLEDFAGRMTASELCSMAGCSLPDLVEFCMSGSAGKAVTKKRSGAAAPRPSRGKTVNTRTKAGREVLDEGVLAVLTGAKSGVAAGAIVEETGANALQVRQSLGRLISLKKAKAEGKARGRRYWAA